MDTQDLLIIGAVGVGLYLLSDSGKNLGTTFSNLKDTTSTVTESVSNVSTGAKYLTQFAFMQFTGKNPLTPNVPSIYSKDFYTQLANEWRSVFA